MASEGRKISLIENKRRVSILMPVQEQVEENYNSDATINAITQHNKTFYNYTIDALPRLDNYRNLMSVQAAPRPTMDDLHDEHGIRIETKNQHEIGLTGPTIKFGWITGCLVRCLLNIWGVMLFLRLPWMVAQAGLIDSMVIIGISTMVTTITTLSMSAVSTNGDMKGGGIYYMISRSLGAEWGGAIGVIFSFANAAMAALNTVGFSESVISLMESYGWSITGDKLNDNRIISFVAILLLQGIIVIGKSWESKCQSVLLVILVVAMGDFIVGAFVGPLSDESRAKGWVSLNVDTLIENSKQGYRHAEGSEQNFFTVFSIFFPAVAGIQAGASISGDLKDPASAIPKGTLLAIFLTSFSYIIFALLAGAGTVRDASGILSEYFNGTFTQCKFNGTCEWGLYNDYQVINLMSLYGPFIYAGCFAATLSSALSCLVSGSEMFQALCQDKIYPRLELFGRVYGKSRDPYWSYVIGFSIAIIFILIADLNAIAPLISNFFMVTYALLNFCVFHASLLKPLGWRPTFKYYNTWMSLAGAVVCVAIMFLMSWITALISLTFVVALYVLVLYSKPSVNWGSTNQAQIYLDALHSLQTLSQQIQHVKNYHPQILTLTGHPSTRPTLIDFAHLLTKSKSLLICANISPIKQPARLRTKIIQDGKKWLESRKIRAFYVMVDNCNLNQGTLALIQSSGLGNLTPNILLLGFKNDWLTCETTQVHEYFNILHEALDNYMAISILRIQEGLDVSHFTKLDILETTTEGCDNLSKRALDRLESISIEDDGVVSPAITTSISKENDGIGGKQEFEISEPTMTAELQLVEEEKIEHIPLSLFSKKQKSGTIDVWWLYDDGGLTLLLPYLISTRKNWSSCNLRIFALANRSTEIEMETQNMARLLSKFRISYEHLTVIPDVTKKPLDKTQKYFDELIQKLRLKVCDCTTNMESIVTESELERFKGKTNRHLRLRELLLEHSSDANLIVMTLPVPRKGNVSAFLYMTWLQVLTNDMPPFLLVRGNQTSVLTFYS